MVTEQQVLAVLGEEVPEGTQESLRLAVADLVAKGFFRRALDRVKAALGVTDAELALSLGISQKTIGRIRARPGARLSPAASDRLYRLAALYAMALEVFEDEQAARGWLKSEQMGLGGRVPLELARTEIGAREVERLLGRMEHGVLW